MSLIFFDGFDSYPDGSAPPQRGWERGGSIEAGRFADSRCINIGGGNQPMGRAVPSGNTFSVGFAIRFNQLGGAFANGKHFVGFRNSGTDQMKLGIFQNGKIAAGRVDWTSTFLCETPAGLILPNVWNYVECEFVRDNAAGSVKIYVNGINRAEAIGVNTGGSPITEIKWFGEDLDSNKYFDDVYITDSTRLGECRVMPLRPSADTAQKDWVPSTGTTNYNLVNEQAPNGDTNYVSSATPGATDLYDIADMPYTPDAIHGVTTIISARKDDAEARQVRAVQKSGSTTTQGTPLTLNTTYQSQADLYDNNPATAAEWTAADINALQIGVQVV